MLGKKTNKQNKKGKRRNNNRYHRDTKKIVRDYYKQLYANKLDNLEEIKKFLETYNQLKLSQEETDNLNRLITSSGIKFVIKRKKDSASKSPGLDGFTGEFSQTYKEVIPILLKILPRIEEDGIIPNSFSESSTTLITNPEKYTTKQNHRPISQMNIDANQIQEWFKEYSRSSKIYPRNGRMKIGRAHV